MSKLLAMMMNKKYTRLEYIESTGTQYIDTGIRANQDTTIKIKGSTINSGTQIYGGCSTSGYLWGIGQQSNGNYLFGQYYTQSGNNRILTNYAGNDGVARTLELRKNEFYIDGELIGSITAKTFTTNTIKLFTLNPSSSIANIKIYFAQIEDENGNLVYDAIPVIRNSDNEIGMLDRVSGQFFGNVGTGKFRVPNEVGYTVVGSPTITDDVVSGFSASDYLKLAQRPNFNQNQLEIKIKFTTGNDFSSNYGLGGIAYSYFFGYTSNSKLFRFPIAVIQNGESKNLDIIVFTATENTTYYFIFTYNNGNCIWKYSTDGFNYIVSHTETVDNLRQQDFDFTIGKSSFGVFNGIIDLNETYIKIDGKLWFNGQPAE